MPNESNHDDFALIQRLQQGDGAAYIELYNRYHLKMYGWLISFVKLHDLAEDIVQETFLKIWEIRHRLNPEQSFPAYLYRISRNKALKTLKKVSRNEELRKRIRVQSQVELNDPEKIMQWQQYQELLNNAISRLPSQRQKVFRLCREKESTYMEVADELNISRNTVKEHMIKAVQDLRQCFYQYDKIVSIISLPFFLF